MHNLVLSMKLQRAIRINIVKLQRHRWETHVIRMVEKRLTKGLIEHEIEGQQGSENQNFVSRRERLWIETSRRVD